MSDPEVQSEMMMAALEVVRGQVQDRFFAEELIKTIRPLQVTGTLYLGYPVVASADEAVRIDALLVSREHGLVAFLFAKDAPSSEDDAEAWARISDEQDRLYMALESHLGRHDSLRTGRRLGVSIEAVTVFPVTPYAPPEINGIYCSIEEVPGVLDKCEPINEQLFRPLEAALQRVTTIKPIKKRAKAKTAHSRGTVIKRIEREIANLDRWQKRAAIESPEGPQRIRGLAGSGKTVVLAHKAAYFHAQHPDWTIAVTFHTRSLYQQFKDLIRRFSFEHLGDEPDWERLRILHSWGSGSREGVYAQLADACGMTRRDFLYATSMYGREDAFAGVCRELLSATSSMNVEPLYDAVLIDEAQDLPPAFFQLVHRFTRPPKRIVWAYDELQKLSEAGMPPIETLFGTDDRGQPRVQLGSAEGQPRRDIILPRCYRNTPWALTVAHALGFGIYRPDKLVQHFDEPGLWAEIGYSVRDGELAPGKRVVLERNQNSYPEYFEELIKPDDAVQWESFGDEIEEAAWVASSVRRNIEQDELDADDILIILPDAYTAKTRSRVVIEALANQGIDAHLAGVHRSRDELFAKGSIAIAHIHRAKGNEAPMVYLLDCQYCVSGLDLITRRNSLFTGVTRSRAWVRLCGIGPKMEALAAEAQAVRDNAYRLDFTVPTQFELEKMRMIHRDRTPDERARAVDAAKGLKKFMDALQNGDLDWENIPSKTRAALDQLLGKGEDTIDDAE